MWDYSGKIGTKFGVHICNIRGVEGLVWVMEFRLEVRACRGVAMWQWVRKGTYIAIHNNALVFFLIIAVVFSRCRSLVPQPLSLSI